MLSRITLSVSLIFFKAAGSAQSASVSKAFPASERNCVYRFSELGVLKMSRKRFPATRAIEASVAKDWEDGL